MHTMITALSSYVNFYCSIKKKNSNKTTFKISSYPSHNSKDQQNDRATCRKDIGEGEPSFTLKGNPHSQLVRLQTDAVIPEISGISWRKKKHEK